jgi:hypothetical protein
MPREIITQKDLEMSRSKSPRGPDDKTSSTNRTEDSFNDRLLKFIPTEVVATYAFVEGVIHQTATTKSLHTVYWIVFFLFWAFTPLYLWRIQHVSKALQLIISFLAFFVWVFALGEPFSFLPWYEPIYAAVLLPVFTFAVAMIKPEQ